MAREVECRVGRYAVALETTLLAHGVPRSEGKTLGHALEQIVRDAGGEPATVGIIEGRPVVGMSETDLAAFLATPDIPKTNTANLGLMLHQRRTAATTVSATMELAAAAGVRLFATGGLGGIHRGYGEHLDISADLAAFTRFPVAVVASGVKSILDVVATREALETLGVPVVGFGTDRFPAFYTAESDAGVDARFDDVADLAAFITAEIERTGRGVLIANPPPAEHAIPRASFERWLSEAMDEATKANITGRDATPFLLGRLHERSDRRTLRTNLELVKSNARLAGLLSRELKAAADPDRAR